MSPEKVKIAEIDIGVDKLLSKAAQTKKEIAELEKSQKSLKKETEGLTTASQSQLEQYTLGEIEIKKYKKEVRDSQKVLDAYINIQNKEIKTKNDARDANRKLIAIANQLDATNEDQAATLKKVNEEIDDNTNFIKDNASEYEKTKINVGNYKEAITGALGELGIFGQMQGKVNSVTKAAGPIITFVSTNLKQVKEDYIKASAATTGMSKAQIAAHLTSTALSAGLRILKIALAATGIGLVVVVLGSLIAYFAKTQAGIDLFNVVLAKAGAAFDVIIDRVAKFGGAVKSFLSGNFTEGIEGMTTAFEGMGDEMQREIDLAGKLETVFQNVLKAEINLDIRRSAANARLEELKLISDDVTKSTEDRIKASEDFIKIEQKLTAEQIANQEKRVAAMLGFDKVTDEVRDKIKMIGQEGVSLDELGISESTIEDMGAFRDEVVKLFDIQQQSFGRQTENQNKLNALRAGETSKQAADAKAASDLQAAYAQKAIEEAQKVTDAAISESKTRLQIFIEENKGKADSLAESIALEEQVRDRKIAILKEELDANKLTQSEYELGLLESKNTFLEQQSQITADYAQKEIEIQLDKDEQLKEIEQLKAEAKATDLQNRREIEQENFDVQFDLELQRLEIQRQAEIAAAEKTGADVTLINKKFAKIQEDIEDEKQNAKRQMAADTLGSMASIFGEETALGKAAALASALINTYLGITAGVKLGWPAMIPAVAAAAATGFGAVKNIVKTKTPKAERGIAMDINGPSHSQGGTTFYDANGNPVVEAQGGEKMVILKREASKELDVLSFLNQKHGGVNLSTPVRYAANGGAIIRTPQSTGNIRIPNNLFDYEQLGNVLADRVNAIVPVVPVDQITNVANKTARVEQGANL
jgi:hypothetical protein